MAFIKYRSSITPTIPTVNEVVAVGLTNLEVDGNFKSLDSTKVERSGDTITGNLTVNGDTTANLVGGRVDGISIGNTTPVTILKVDNLSLDGNTLASTNTNGNIVLAPNGTGDVQLDADTVRIGDVDSTAILTTNGASSLTLNTNSGVDSGSITINSGADTNIAITPNGSGLVQVGSSLYVTGNLTVLGNTTNTTITTVSISDPVITLSGGASTVETTKDRGVEFKWNGTTLLITNYIGDGTTTVVGTVADTTGYAAGDIITISGASGTQQNKLNGTWTITSILTSTTFSFVVGSTVAVGTITTNLGTTVKSKNGFFGLKQSAGKFTFIPQSLNSNQVFSGNAGVITAGDVQIKDYSINASMWSRSFALMGA